MAEAAATIGLISSITSLVDLSVKVVSRVRDYSAHATDVPGVFRSLADRLPLLTQALKRVRSRAQAGSVAIDTAREINILVDGILEQVKLIEQYLEGLTPTSSASRFDRALVGLKSLAKDGKVKQAVDKIHHGMDVLVLHQTTDTIEVSDRILREVSQLSLQNSPTRQLGPDPVAHRTLGLYLGHAPLIAPDAFVGRTLEMQQLHDWLSPPRNAQTRSQRVVSIVGMGGLGKTQLSLAYAREYGNQYSSVFWLNAKDPTSLRRGILSLAAFIFPDNFVAPTNPNEERIQVDKVRRWLSEESNDQWLIIFDNYDDPTLPNVASKTGFDLRRFFPMRTQGNILITTRSSKLTYSKQLKLQKLLDLDTCVAVLSQRSGRDMTQDQDSRLLAERLDGLPLALAVTGTYLAQINASCAEYLNLYETAWNDLHGPDAEVLMEYADRTLSSTWIISLDQVRRQDADAAELFQFLGYLNNDDIWYELIKCGADSGPSWMSRLTSSKVRFDRAMSKLADYSLVETGGGSYRIHACLHDWIFQLLNTALSESLFTTTIFCLKGNLTDSLNQEYWTLNRRLVNHIKRIQHQRFTTLWHKTACNEDVLHAGDAFGRLLQSLCELFSAEKMLVWVLASKEKTLGPEHTSTLDTVTLLGNIYSDQGKLAEAERMYLRALAGREKVLGPEHGSTLNIVSNLGLLYYDQDILDKAEDMYTRALKGQKKATGLADPSTLVNLAILFTKQGKFNEAEELYLRVLAIREVDLGAEHPSTLSVVHNLGYLYDEQSKFDEAERMYMRALAGQEKLVGPEHTGTLRTVDNLGVLYAKQGRLDEAEQMYLRAIAGREKTLGPEHRLAVSSVNNLSILNSHRDKLKRASRRDNEC